MSRGVVIAEPHQQLRITIHQPAFPSGLRWGFMSGAIAIRHRWSLALIRFDPCTRKASCELNSAVDQLLIVNLASWNILAAMCSSALELIARSLHFDFRTFSQVQ